MMRKYAGLSATIRNSGPGSTRTSAIMSLAVWKASHSGEYGFKYGSALPVAISSPTVLASELTNVVLLPKVVYAALTGMVTQSPEEWALRISAGRRYAFRVSRNAGR